MKRIFTTGPVLLLLAGCVMPLRTESAVKMDGNVNGHVDNYTATNNGYLGDDKVQYQVQDSHGALSNVATVTFHIVPAT